MYSTNSGPAIGYVVGGEFLSIHTDLDYSSGATHDSTNQKTGNSRPMRAKDSLNVQYVCRADSGLLAVGGRLVARLPAHLQHGVHLCPHHLLLSC
jgi:hypothetical protein